MKARLFIVGLLIAPYLLFNFSLYSMEGSFNAKALDPILKRARSLVQEGSDVPPFIAIAGGTGVGKSYVALELAHLFEQEDINAIVLKCDDFLDPNHNDEGTFHPRFKHFLVHSVIQKIKKGQQKIVKPMWDLKSDPLREHLKEEVLLLNGVDLILFEGEFVLCEQSPYDFKKYSEFGIWVDAADEDIAKWNWERKRGSARNVPKEEYIKNVKAYLLKYRSFTESCLLGAQYHLNKGADHSYNLMKLLNI